MSQHYSDPSREADPHALPNIETFECGVLESPCCNTLHPANYVEACSDQPCFTCEQTPRYWEAARNRAWFYWYCFPGCLPDGDPIGPFATEAEALADAREGE